MNVDRTKIAKIEKAQFDFVKRPHVMTFSLIQLLARRSKIKQLFRK